MARSEGRAGPVPHFLSWTRGNRAHIICNILTSDGYLKEDTLFHLTQISTWEKSWKYTVGIAHESHRRTTDLPIPGAREYGWKKYNRTSRVMRRSWGKTLWEIKMFKVIHVYGGIVEKNKNWPGKTHVHRRPQKTLSVHTGWIQRLTRCPSN